MLADVSLMKGINSVKCICIRGEYVQASQCVLSRLSVCTHRALLACFHSETACRCDVGTPALVCLRSPTCSLTMCSAKVFMQARTRRKASSSTADVCVRVCSMLIFSP